MANLERRWRRDARRVLVFLRRHAAAFAVAACVGGLMVAPQVAFRVWMGDAYRGIGFILVQDATDAAWYHAVIGEAMEGGKPWNAILAEHKGDSYPVPDLAERILALPGQVFHETPQAVLSFWRFVLPAILTLVIYAVGLRLTRSRALSIASAFIVMCASPFVQDPSGMFRTLAGTGAPSVFTLFDRPVHPQFDAPFLWAFFLSATLAFVTPAKRRYWIACGLLLGFLTYTYTWAWTWGYAACATLLVIAAVTKRGQAVAAVAKAWGIAVAIGLPKLFMLATSVAVGGGGYAERMGLVVGHVPGLFSRLTVWLVAPSVFALVAAILVRRRLTPLQRTFVFAGLGASVAAVTQHFVTRVMFNPDHYMTLMGAPFATWVLVLCAHTALNAVSRRLVVGIGVAACVVSFVAMAGIQARLFEQGREYARELQPFTDVAAWLNAHADRKTVVFANERIGLLVPAMTPANLWWHSYAMAVPSTEPARIRHAANTWFLLNGYSADDLRYLGREWPINLAHFFTMTTVYEERVALIRGNLDSWVSSFEAFQKGTDARDAIRAYRVDYVLYDAVEDAWDPGDLDVGEPVVRSGRFTLYPVRP